MLRCSPMGCVRVSELPRCGKVYNGFDEAWKAAELRTIKIISCDLHPDVPGAWHIRQGKTATTRVERYRPDPFPPVVAALIDKRDQGLCQGCGRGGQLERHHRRLKGMGGSKARSHTQCCCNGLSLCRTCHAWAHEHPAMARSGEYGWIVIQGAARPARIGVIRFAKADPEWSAADQQWATCDGRWVHGPMEAED